MDVAALREAFRQEFGQDAEIVTLAPGRVNLIGEHTDYNEGFVFPAAIDRELMVAARVVKGPSRLVSIQLGPAKEFEASKVKPKELDDWGQYAAGMAWALRDKGSIPNIEALVSSDVPIGSGVSSSAAMELAFGVLYDGLAKLNLDNKQLALLGQKDENEFVGVNSGVMDQMASALGREGKAMFLDTRTLDIEYASIPQGIKIVLCDTNTPRALTTSAYNERRSQCEEAAKALGVKALRDATMEMLDKVKAKMPEVVYRRAKHVITENRRCRDFLKALESNQTDQIGRLMRESHESLRVDYEVSSRELDAMAKASWDSPGCVGARMTGAGFGGACVALVRENEVEDFAKDVNTAYEKSSGMKGEIFACRAVDGARILWQS